MKRKRYVFVNLDASESAFFSRQLEYVEKEIYETRYPELNGRDLVPVKTDIPSGAETYTYYEWDQRGVAKIISDYANDLPRADVLGKQTTSYIKSLGASYGYSLQEIRAAQMAGVSLDSLKGDAARRAIEEGIDTLIQKGSSAHNLLGLLNQPNAITYVTPNGVSGFPQWSKKTSDEILADMNGIANAIYTTTKGIERGDTIILPNAQYGLIASQPRSSLSDTTILEFFLKSNPWIKAVVPWYACTGAGAASSDRMVCYRRDKRALEVLIPQEFETRPPQEKGLAFEVPCHARCGGVVVRLPLSMAYADNI